MIKCLLDNGHGAWTAGKRSPDGRLREGVYAREIARRVAEALEERGIPYALLTPENDDTPLATRVYRANQLNKQHRDGTILISLHSDATSSSGWDNAQGMSVRVSLNASQRSKTLARCMYSAWESRALKVRKYNGDMTPYWPQDLAICRDTHMPAVLIEMFFHNNRSQVTWALTDAGKNMIVSAIVDGIVRYVM